MSKVIRYMRHRRLRILAQSKIGRNFYSAEFKRFTQVVDLLLRLNCVSLKIKSIYAIFSPNMVGVFLNCFALTAEYVRTSAQKVKNIAM